MEYTDEIRNAYMVLTKAGFTCTMPKEVKDLVPMVDADKFSIPQYHTINITVRDANHFRRAVKFARDNDLEPAFAMRFLNLMELLIGYQLETQLYPEGYKDPGFGWQGCGMLGGFIFHHATRDWSIHT